MDDFFCHADLFVANATHFYFSEVGGFLRLRFKFMAKKRGGRGGNQV